MTPTLSCASPAAHGSHITVSRRVSCVQSTVIFLSEFTYKQNLSQMKCKVDFQPCPQKSPPTHVYHYMPLIMTDSIGGIFFLQFFLASGIFQVEVQLYNTNILSGEILLWKV